MKDFTYMPRITILPGPYEEERIRTLVTYCKKYRYDEVMFFVNAENLNDGHIEIKKLQPYIDTILRAKEALKAEGILTSLNPWNCLLGCERGISLKEGQNFDLMVDIDGNTGKATPCPLSEGWRNYFTEYYLYLIEKVRPEIIWIEDDFRMHNHYPLNWGGCFCDKHLALYADLIGHKVTAREMADGMADGREDNAYRKAYYSVTRKVMRDLAEEIGKSIHARFPEQKIGLMTSDPKMHSIEGRDWAGVLYGLSGQTVPIDRIHLPAYRQCCAQDYSWCFHDISMQTRALIPEETCVLPEIENAMFSPYTKSLNFTRFQAESALSLCPQGLTLDLDCFAGNGIVPEYGYGEKLADIKDYLISFSRLGLKFSSMRGITIPVREDAFLYATPQKELSDIRINENWWASQLASLGIAFHYDKAAEFKNRIVAVSGNYLDGLSDEQIKQLFADNYILLEGNGVKSLFHRGLNGLIGAKSFHELSNTCGAYSFEEASEGKRYLNIPGARASSYVTCPDFLNIEYSDTEKNIYTNMFGRLENFVGIGEVSVGNVFILPYLCEGKHHGLLTTMRAEILREALAKVEKDDLYLYTTLPYVTPYVYSDKNTDVLFLVNYSDDAHECVSVYGLREYRHAEILDRKNGRWRRVGLEKDGDKVVIPEPLFATASLTVRLIK